LFLLDVAKEDAQQVEAVIIKDDADLTSPEQDDLSGNKF